MSFVPLVRFWLWISAFASAAGWTLSAFGQLNRTGYAIAFAIFVPSLWLGRKKLGLVPTGKLFCGKKILRRFRRPLPFAFMILALLVFVGSVIHPPSNYTGLNYHLARVLQWLSHERWFWIHTTIERMNYSGCDFEWLTTPIVLFTQSDRALFMVNVIPYLFLPGLVFSAFTRLGVSARVAWTWMWLLPTGYNFLLQAGSIGNDTISAIFALAAVDFGCRAWKSRRVYDLWPSVLAIALMTGTKPISLPILLPWLILVLPLLGLLRRNWLPTLPVIAFAGFASFFPLALMNRLHSGDWLGRTVEIVHKEVHQPLVGIFGNTFQLLLGNFLPPLFPLAGWWNVHALLILPHRMVDALNANFEGGILQVGELPTEDWVGLGFGISWLLVVSLFSSFWINRNLPASPMKKNIPRWVRQGVQIGAWLSLVICCMKSGLNTAPRLFAPYYLLLLPLLLAAPGQSHIIRRTWWRRWAGAVPGLALAVLVLSPDRPLWPAKTILASLHAQHPAQRQIDRALRIYTVYARRWDALAGVRALLPPGIKVVGFIGSPDDCDISLWRPFGERRVEHFLQKDSTARIRERAEYVVVGGSGLEALGLSFADWQQKTGAEFIASTNVTLKASEGQQPWYLVRFKP